MLLAVAEGVETRLFSSSLVFGSSDVFGLLE